MANAITKVRQGIRDRAEAKKKSSRDNSPSTIGGQSRESGPVLVTPQGKVVGTASPTRSGGGGGSGGSTPIPSQTIAPTSDLAAARQASIQQQQAQARVQAAAARREKIALSIQRKQEDSRMTRVKDSDIRRVTSSRRQITSRRNVAKVVKPVNKSNVRKFTDRTKAGFKTIVNPFGDNLLVLPGGTLVKKDQLSDKQLRQAELVRGIPSGTEIFALSGIKPLTPRVTGEAAIIPKAGNKFNVKVISTAREPITGSKAITFSQQSVRDISKNVNVGTGKAITFSKSRGEIISTVSRVTGASKNIGRASIVSRGSKTFSSINAGKGFISKSFIKDLSRTKTNKGISIGVPKTQSQSINSALKNQRITGFIKKGNREGVSKLIASSRPTTTRISKDGVTKILKNPNINIDVGFGKFPSDIGSKGVNFIGKDIGKGSTSKTIQGQRLNQVGGSITSSVAKSIDTSQKLSSIKSAKELGVKTLGASSKLSFPKSISTKSSITGNVIAPTGKQSISNLPGLSSNSFNNLGQTNNQRASISSINAISGRTRSRPRTKLDTRSAQPQRINQIQTSGLKQSQKTRVLSIPKLSQLSRQSGTARPIFNINIPTNAGGIFRLPSIKGSAKTISPEGKFAVSVRRRGIFRTVGRGLSGGRAINVGRNIVGGSLAATFKLTPQSKGISTKGFGTPRGFKRKKGGLFIESPSLRLSTSSEVQEIKTARIKT